MQKHAYAMEYVDDDGDPVVRHVMLTEDEARRIMDAMAADGRWAQLHRTGQQLGDGIPDVSSLPWPRIGKD